MLQMLPVLYGVHRLSSGAWIRLDAMEWDSTLGLYGLHLYTLYALDHCISQLWTG